ncbi:MAG: ribosomal-processing cysteine protease Prp [Treponemataceae bacterium]|nr:ribosomal-processing cysteine protease Prp [Treponemataceae bacterium]
MITAVLCKRSDGAFASCEVSGHAEFAPKGADIVCAAVSTVVRTTVAVLQSTDSAEPLVTCDSSEHGQLAFRATEMSSAFVERLVFAADYLQKGLEIIAAEYPKYLKLRVKTVK